MSDALQEKSGRRRKRRQAEVNETAEENLEERGLSDRKGRATPGRRSRRGGGGGGATADSGNFITRPIRGIREYLGGVRDELDKVVWPTREELIRLSRIVLIVTVIASLVLGAFSIGFTELFIIGFENEWVFALFFALVIGGGFLFYRMNKQQDDLRRY